MPHLSGGAIAINDRCLLRTQDGHRVVVVAGVVTAQYALGDRMAEAHAMVSLVEQGWADQNDVARAFGCSARTLRRHERRFEAGGLAALGQRSGYPKGRRRLKAGHTKVVLRLKAEGVSNRAIAHRVGVSEKAIRNLLRRVGWAAGSHHQASLPLGLPAADPNLSASPAASAEVLPEAPRGAEGPSLEEDERAVSLDVDPADRRLDRLLAYVGMLEDATPMFRPGTRVPRAGVLVAMPALLGSGVLEIARQLYGNLAPAFYGLRTTLVSLLLMALLRIKRAESLKEHPPEDLGRVLGLDRAPEVKTLRRKLARLASLGHSAQFGRALAERRVAARGAAVGFLYVDGHVRVYHGRHRLPKAHVARMRLCMPATSDYWVNDAQGEPLFVVTAEANAGLVRMLPGILAEVRGLVGQRRVTVVFDRGGFSPRLFHRLVSEGFDILTYRKGRFPRVGGGRFRKHSALIEGRQVRYELADQGVALLGGRLRLRQVTRLSENGHQTPILTSRRDLPAAEVAYRMFERWRQENFFKYLREEYALDALVDYAVEPDEPAREVPNPERRRLDGQLRHARAELVRLQAEYGRGVWANPEGRRPTVRGFKIAHGKLGRAVRSALKRVEVLEAERS
ncbi:MAG: putative transposase, partial [Candidatus Rokuibacteriota bacterium]